MSKLRLVDRAYVDILGLVEAQSLKVGDRLPSELALTRALGVSRTIVRETLARLGSDGVVEARPGAGSYLVRVPSRLLSRHMAASDLPAALGTYEVRFVLEAEAARLAAQRRSLDDLAEITACLDALRKALLSSGRADAEDIALHRAIARATGNAAFLDSFDAIQSGVAKIMRAGIDISRDVCAIEAMIREHEDIVAAIRNSDPERAALSMRWHLAEGRNRLML
ncbi:FadR/GntR family transcriptional regulator [Novosphingobium pituita]|uniref:FadR/GntR family transcriptional regulator n=1 Tax=Novosphingobium pituita TaxID=3056842 RepID=A0ABQ6PAN8_9SPHN|nr:FCD domain-containing protein [Novosphingobium sp. IK01]GMM62328.1 FadR/GntR family transcriptional regulator [Novosphingobium sp. IK01]